MQRVRHSRGHVQESIPSTDRRRLLRSGGVIVGVTAVSSWSQPVIESVILPAHAQTTPTPTPQAPSITFQLVQNSGQNEDNQSNNRPHILYNISGNEITFQFVNPTGFAFAFDYRVDLEPGTPHGASGVIISQGELTGEPIGPGYNIVNTPAGTTEVRVVPGTSEIWAGLRLGAEQGWFLDWLIFQAV